MKRMIFVAACIVALISCRREQDQLFDQEEFNLDGSEFVLASATDFVNGNELTRTVISQEGTAAPTFAWKDGDVIGVIPMNNETVQSNYKIAQIGSDPKQALFDGGVWALKEGKEYAAYYPFNEKIARSGDNLTLSFLGQKQSANNSLEHLGAYDYMYASPVVCTNNVATFEFKHLISLVRIQLTAPFAETFNAVSLESSEDWFASSASLKLSDGTATAVESQKSCSIELNDIQVASGDVLTVWFSVLPTASLKNKTLSVKFFGNNENVECRLEISAEWTAGKAYAYDLGPEAIDLGLPSGLKWATCNLGASKPEEYGGYYQWAGREEVTNTSIYLDYSNCPYHTGSSSLSGWTKYIPSDQSSYWSGSGSPDNKTVLDPEDDAAQVKLGDKWRMPTGAECEELYDNCTSEWITLNGVNGTKFTSKKNGRSIFLPAAGICASGELYDVGSSGSYWSSSLNVNNPADAYLLHFGSGYARTGRFARFAGQSVRPVSEEGVIHVTGLSLGKSSVTLAEGDSETLTVTISPSDATNHNVTWSSSNPDIATVDGEGRVVAVKAGSTTITVKTVDRSYTSTCTVTVIFPVPEAVDLGFPSGIKWASSNLGAFSPEVYGGYYLWAGLEDVTGIYFDGWRDCPYHKGSNSLSGWTKYIPLNCLSYWSGTGSADNKTVLDLEDDVAHVKLGGKWRMPTETEWEELYDNCTSEWISVNGVGGRKFTSKKNGKSIFLPVAGRRASESFYDVGTDGYYWSSSLNLNNPSDAYLFHFGPSFVGFDKYGRFVGQSVRPVYGDKVGVTGVSLSTTSLSLNVRATSTLSATVIPSNATEQSVSWSSSNTAIATVDVNGKVTAINSGSATITVKTTDGGYTATCQVTVIPEGIKAVDLGLPTGLKWASCNLGATKPEEYGSYYQWAGLEDVTKTSIYLDWNNCPYHTGSSYETGWTKYIPLSDTSYWSGTGRPDSKIVLDLEDDVAHVKLGGSWRMPTEDEYTQLFNNCTSEWTTLNGVKGIKFTSKKNGNSIFLPAAGCRIGTRLDYVGSIGYYWSSALYEDLPYCAGGGCLLSSEVCTVTNYRYFGFSVRPVSE